MRRIWTSAALTGDLNCPHALQVFVIQRDTTEMVSQKFRTETVYGATSFKPHDATPQRLLGLRRGRWSIENRLHWVRDVTFDKERSRVRKNAGPQVRASIRNLVISLLRMASATNMAQGLRRLCPHAFRGLPFHRYST